jgi:hypothetical protein
LSSTFEIEHIREAAADRDFYARIKLFEYLGARFPGCGRAADVEREFAFALRLGVEFIERLCGGGSRAAHEAEHEAQHRDRRDADGFGRNISPDDGHDLLPLLFCRG